MTNRLLGMLGYAALVVALFLGGANAKTGDTWDAYVARAHVQATQKNITVAMRLMTKEETAAFYKVAKAAGKTQASNGNDATAEDADQIGLLLMPPGVVLMTYYFDGVEQGFSIITEHLPELFDMITKAGVTIDSFEPIAPGTGI